MIFVPTCKKARQTESLCPGPPRKQEEEEEEGAGISDSVSVEEISLAQEDLLPAFPQKVGNQPVGGRLSLYIENWKMITSDPFVLSVVEDGYRIVFWEKPPLTREPKPSRLPADRDKREAIKEQLKVLLEKGVVEEVQDPRTPGFYNRFFVTPKKEPGKWRSILDLSNLGQRYIPREGFKMETAEDVRSVLETGEWATSLDFTDAYFHVMIHKKSRKYLRFSLSGRVYQFRALPMGLCTSARIFTRLIKVVKEYVQKRGIFLHQYIDDWLVHAKDPCLVHKHTQVVKHIAESLGYVINVKKSEFIPSQEFVYLGLRFSLKTGLVAPSEERWCKIQKLLVQFLASRRQRVLAWQSLVGRMVSAARVVKLGMLHARPMQMALRENWCQRTGSQMDWIEIEQDVRECLEWWTVRDNVMSGVPFRAPKYEVQVFTDACTTGWGGCMDVSNVVKGVWNQKEKSLHINALEMLAVVYSLLHFQKQVCGKVVMVATDNSTVVSYLQREGGTRSKCLLELTLILFDWIQKNKITLQCRHVAGRLNVIADSLSRAGQVLPTEWTLSKQILEDVWRVWDKPMVDLFATRYTTRMPLFVSPVPDQQAMAVDALSLDWKGMYAYAFPPTAILKLVLKKIQEEDCVIVLVAPCWPKQVWFPQILDLLIELPIVLPCKWYLLKQPQSDIFHQMPERLNLHMWKLSRIPSLRKDFLEQLRRGCPDPSKSPQAWSTTPSGGASVVGVTQGMQILARHLYH